MYCSVVLNVDEYVIINVVQVADAYLISNYISVARRLMCYASGFCRRAATG